MRGPRLKKAGTGVYHCISRAVAGAFLLDDEAKTKFQQMLREVAEFSGVEVLAHCVMTNHYHVLVRVPKGVEVSREEVLRRYGFLYTASNTPGYPDAANLRLLFAEGDEAVIEDWMARLTGRMNDVSEFMKTLKQRFTMWYNKRHKRFGTLWSERFKSVLVQNDPAVLRTVAAYVDLNPVRAGLAKQPEAYAWCSYGEATRGVEAARVGLMKALRGEDWEGTLRSYRSTLFGKAGIRSAANGEGGASGAGTGEGECVEGGVLCERQPAISGGDVLGSVEFVESVSRSLDAPDSKTGDLTLGGRTREPQLVVERGKGVEANSLFCRNLLKRGRPKNTGTRE